jgi:hypothetical protein
MKSYENLYLEYLQQQRGVTDIPTDPSLLNSTLASFWPCLRTLKNEEYQASTLQHIRACLRLFLQEKIHVDIFNDPALLQQNKVFENYIRTLKKRGKGAVHHYEEIPREDLRLIILVLGHEDPTSLQMLAWFYIQLFFCKRGMEKHLRHEEK